MPEPLPQTQAPDHDPDHDRQQGRVEGILEQVLVRLDSMEDRVTTMEANHRQDMATMEANHRQDMATLRQDNSRLEVRLTSLENRQAVQFRWLIGIQLTTLLALGTLILTRLP